MRYLFIGLFICLNLNSFGQELFVFTEPASNMPAKSIGIRGMNIWQNERSNNSTNYHLMPEIMLGLSKNFMVHVQAFISDDKNKSMKYEGGAFYAKYRLYSADDVHKHFRLASYGRISYNNADIHQQEIETMGHNSGYELGFVATQLLHKIAIGSSLSFESATHNGSNYRFPTTQPSNALNYTLSMGKLLLPKKYINYKQLNVNVMVELLGQRLFGSNLNFLDLAPSIQFIMNSQARIDIAYRHEIINNMQRTAPNGFAVKLEYTIFNFIK